MQTMSLSRLSLKQSKGVISQLRASHDNRKIYDEWDNPTMPKWARELYDDPKFIDEARKLPQETDWKKKALWRRFAWNRDFEKYIPQAVDDIATLDRPSIWQKIYARFKGIPLKGEPHLPKSVFDDIGKVFLPPPDHPPVQKDYKEYPERDLINFPNPPGNHPFFAPKTRILLFPDSWFQPFYSVTGVSGPYLLLIGFSAFCLSKEIIIIMEDFGKHIVWVTFYLFMHHAFSHRFTMNSYKKQRDTYKMYYGLKEDELKGAKEFRQNAALITDSFKAIRENFPTILKENLALQLEAAYRTNVQMAYAELKKRLDYMNEVEETKDRFEREIIIKSISEGVRNQISTNQNKIRDRYLENCIAQLKAIPAV